MIRWPCRHSRIAGSWLPQSAANSFLAATNIGRSASVSFQVAKKSWYAFLAFALSFLWHKLAPVLDCVWALPPAPIFSSKAVRSKLSSLGNRHLSRLRSRIVGLNVVPSLSVPLSL